MSVFLALCKTNLDDSVRGYLPSVQKDSTTHMHSLAVYVNKVLPFAWDLSLENFQILTYVFHLLVKQVENISKNLPSFLEIHPTSSSFCMVFDSILSKRWGSLDQPIC